MYIYCTQYLEQLKTLSHENKYLNWYISICTNAISRQGLIKKRRNSLVYVEDHHIIPRSFELVDEKDPNNLVFLTGREHYIVHKLLPKFLANTLFRYRMINAAWMMANTKKDDRLIKISSRSYESLKIAHSENMRLLIAVYHPRLLISKKVYPIEIEKYLLEGYEYGSGKIYSDEEKLANSLKTLGKIRVKNILLNNSKMVKLEEVEHYFSLGYKYGMIRNVSPERQLEINIHRNTNYEHPTAGKIGITNKDDDYIFIDEAELSKYKELGYIRGRPETSVTGRMCIKNENTQENKMIFPEEFEFYQSLGFESGYIIFNKFIPTEDDLINRSEIQKGLTHIKHTILGLGKRVKIDELSEYLDNGWEEGVNERRSKEEIIKINENKPKLAWIINKSTQEIKRIHKNKLLDYLTTNDWLQGRSLTSKRNRSKIVKKSKPILLFLYKLSKKQRKIILPNYISV